MSFISDYARTQLALPNTLPSTVSGFKFQETPPAPTPDGNADRTFGRILRSDMMMYLDGSIPLTQQPQFSLELEPPLTNGANGSANWVNFAGKVADPGHPGYYFYDTAWTKNNVNLPTHPQYVNTADFEGTLRWDQANGPYKFGRIKSGQFAGALVFSAHKNDQYYGVSRGRSMAQWVGSNVFPIYGQTLISAQRIYFDIDPPTVPVSDPAHMKGQLLFWQYFAYPYNGGMFPYLALHYDTTNDHIRLSHQYSTTSPSIQTSSSNPNGTTTEIQTNIEVGKFSYSSLVRRWVDFVYIIRPGWDLAAHQPFARFYIDDTLCHSIDNTPIGYNPPAKASSGLTYSIDTMVAMGLYPPSGTLTPNTERKCLMKRGFVCRNEGNYSVADIRDALGAPA